MDALETLERVLREENDYPDVGDKEERIAEVSVTRRVLKSVQVRVAVVVVGSGLDGLTGRSTE